MSNVFNILKERDYIAQMTHEEEIKNLLENEKVTFYIGFDPTADSLHVGHFLQLIVMSHMQKAGHRPIALIGGGTGMVGDPSGRTDMRQMLTPEEINHNVENFKKQMSRFIDFSDGKALIVNNADWLLDLNYVDFLREIGVHFSVNRMLAAECFKSRYEKGLNFLEFNYMLMQSYDFLKLFWDYGCRLQLGGDDQWSNIIGGIELVRRVESESCYGMTFNLLTTSEGIKMGKTQKGAIWLDADKTTPYEFYQYWRNVADDDVIKCLKLLTFIPMEQINAYSKLEGQDLNDVKKVLAYEVTKLVHGEDEADKALKTAEALFSKGADDENMPSTVLTIEDIGDGINIIDLMLKVQLIPSKGEGRRLVQQGGVYVDEERVENINLVITRESFKDDKIIIRKGKKKFHRVTLG